jgi:hypothetical protein
LARVFKIHPAIGIARAGDSDKGMFIGPEQPGVPANWDASLKQSGSFRDQTANAGILRQGARFRVFEYQPDDQGKLIPREIVLGQSGITSVTWTVHLANKKGNFFAFNGQDGAATNEAKGDEYLARAAAPPARELRKRDDGKPLFNVRNAAVGGPFETAAEALADPGRQKRLEIDAPERSITAPTDAGKPVLLASSNDLTKDRIPDLGVLCLDEAGRLIILGGHGRAAFVDDGGNPVDPDAAPNMVDYANNDGWYDDMADGPVTAKIVVDGAPVEVDAPAWVLVGPPDFAPGVGNAVNLFDTLWDLTVRLPGIPLDASEGRFIAGGALNRLVEQRARWSENTLSKPPKSPLTGYRPSFTKEIFPILQRALLYRRVHDPGPKLKAFFHASQTFDWAELGGGNSDLGKRKLVFRWLRDPGPSLTDYTKMPRGFGDEYDAELIDKGTAGARAFASLTAVQYELLREWAVGNFEPDWVSEPSIPGATPITADGLDQAALENCVGGPLFPGIEVSWLLRAPALYQCPFRLKQAPKAGEPPLRIGALQFGPGFFSQQMAQPWHADFRDCSKEQHSDPDGNPMIHMWWSAQRPDDVFLSDGSQVSWTRDFQFDDSQFERFQEMRRRWSGQGFVVSPDLVEQDRKK